MKASPLKCAGIGALIALAVSVAFLLVGPVDLFGVPEPRWARILFSPGVWAGWRAWDWFHPPVWLCQAAGVLTMTGIGALVGLGIRWLARCRHCRPLA